jgi:hypothetical protein
LPESYVAGIAEEVRNIFCFLRKFSGQRCRAKESCKKKGWDRPGRALRGGEEPCNVTFSADFSLYLRALPVPEVDISGIAV